jgi:hypothetical protein
MGAKKLVKLLHLQMGLFMFFGIVVQVKLRLVVKTLVKLPVSLKL